MIIVLDASAAIELVMKRKQSQVIRKSLAQCDKIISSDLYKAEVTNSHWKYLKAGLISRQESVTELNFALDLIEEYHDIASSSIEALGEAIRLNHSTYDMHYIILAKKTGGILLSLDKRLNSLANTEGIETPLFTKE